MFKKNMELASIKEEQQYNCYSSRAGLRITEDFRVSHQIGGDVYSSMYQ